MTPRRANRLAAITATAIVVCAGCNTKSKAPEAARTETSRAETSATAALHRGVRWLLQQQGADGSWRSKVYGQMSGGVGDTALVNYALVQLRPGQVDREQFTAAEHGAGRGAQFLLSQLADAEHPKRRDGADYPTYGAALLLLSMHDLRHRADSVDASQLARVIDYLKASQQTQATRWKREDPRFGGWNQTGASDPEDARRPGNTNISVTYFAIHALRAHNALDDNATAAAHAFLAGCQNFGPDAPSGDGGFFFTPDADDPLNKAGALDDAKPARARSYGSPTADGLSALAACGVAADDPRVVAAIDWLSRHEGVEAVPGFAKEADGASPAEGLKFYYAAALARAIRAYPNAKFAERKAALVAWLTGKQRPDGSWQNSNNVMREDDPLIATSFAVAALAMLTTN